MHSKKLRIILVGKTIYKCFYLVQVLVALWNFVLLHAKKAKVCGSYSGSSPPWISGLLASALLHVLWYENIRIKNFFAKTLVEHAIQENQVMLVGDPPAVVDMPRHKFHRVPRNCLRLKQEIFCHYDGCLQVWIVELIPYVPAQRTELLPFLDNWMEKTKSKKESTPALFK